jgi:hypothetical protein
MTSDVIQTQANTTNPMTRVDDEYTFSEVFGSRPEKLVTTQK